jgi:ribosomal-protein-alanine N-acetyltransferase
MTGEQEILRTSRLLLRSFRDDDADAVSTLLDNYEFYSNTVNIPFPYTLEDAVTFISSRRELYLLGKAVAWAVTEAEGGTLVGCISLDLDRDASRAEMGYWTGIPWWNRGYCTEAAIAVLGYAFGKLGLNLVEASHFASNHASGRVMRAAGMRRDAVLRQRVCKDGDFLDLVVCSVTAAEFGRPDEFYRVGPD